MKKMHRILTLLLLLSVCIGLFVVSASAATPYSLWVLGEQVTSVNAADVLGDGKVSYNPDTNTLTVSRDLAATGDKNAVRAFTSGVLHIQLSGDRSISSENAGVLYTSNDVEITSDGDVTITCASDVIGPIPNLKISTNGDVTLKNTNDKICNSSLTITGVDGGAAGNVKVSADTTALEGGKFVAQTITVNASGDVEITNAGGAVSTNALTVAGKNVKVSGDKAGALAGDNATINASGNVTLTNESGGISYFNLAIDGVNGGTAGDVKVSADTTTLSGSKFVAQTITVNASGDVEITNAGGAVSTSALTVTGADDVTVTGDTAGFLITSSANIAASGVVTMENANGGICPSKLTITGIDGGAAENVKVSANTKSLASGRFVAQTIEVKAAGDVEITNAGGAVAVTSVDVIADEVLIVGAPAGFDTAVFSYKNVDGAAYVVYEGASEADLSVVKTTAAGETYSSDMDVNVIKITPSAPSAPSAPDFTFPWWGIGILSGAAGGFPFDDVKTTDWFYDEVKDAWENDLIDGVTKDQFRPESELTVAQAIKLAAVLHQKDYYGYVTLENAYGNWYSSYVDYAVRMGVIDSKYQSYNKDQMNAPISREEFVSIFFGALPESSYTAWNEVADNAIPDVKLGDAYAYEIYTFYRAGILTGSDAQGTFHPESSIKRSEVAAILIRMYDVNARQSVTLK